MSDYLGIKVVKKEGTENVFDVTISERSPFKVISDHTGGTVEDMLLCILLNSQEKLHTHIKSTSY